MKVKKKLNRDIFREYDIRGDSSLIDDDTAYTIGLGFGSYIKSIGKTTCVVGHDNRLSGGVLYNALQKGILETGIDIISLGLCTTPMYYYACIKLKVFSEMALNKQDINGVYLGKDGYLVERHEDSKIDVEMLQKSMDRLVQFTEKYANQLGSEHVKVMLVPTASEILTEKLPAFASGFDQNGMIDKIYEQLPEGTALDVRETLKEHADESIYYKTDHHWTARGAYLAANAFLNAAEGEELPTIDKYESGVRENFLGSLYKAVMTEKAGSILENHPDKVEYFYPFADATVTAYSSAKMENGENRDILYPDYSETSNLYCIFMGGDIALGKLETETKNGKSILVVRDSYGHAIIPFLIDAYETIYTVEPRYFNEANKLELGKFFFRKRHLKSLYTLIAHLLRRALPCFSAHSL